MKPARALSFLARLLLAPALAYALLGGGPPGLLLALLTLANLLAY